MSDGAERRIRAFGGYQPGLDGLRGLAVLAMVSYHAQLPASDGAFFSLSLFFTLSGFLITSILMDERHRRQTLDLKRFWIRRFRRLAPAALAGLAIAVVFAATVATRSQAEGFVGELLGALTYVVNWVFVSTDQSYTDLFAAPSPVQHYWSLAIEEQFYVIIPVTMFALMRLRASAAVIGAVFTMGAIASTAWMAFQFENGVDLDRLYYGTDTRLAEVLTGAALAVLMDHLGVDVAVRARRLLAVVGVAATALMLWSWVAISLTDAIVWRGGFLLHALVACVLVVSLLSGHGPAARIFGLRPLVRIGQLSYGIYIYHWPVFLWLTEDRTGLGQWPLFVVRMAIAVTLAEISYRFLETPIRRGARLGVGTKVRVALYPALAVVILGAGAATANTDGDDPLATLRDTGGSTVAVGTDDGVLDLLVIHGSEVDREVERLGEVVAGDSALRLTTEPFDCEVDVGERGCVDWRRDWPGLVERVDPDIVVWFADRWPDASIDALPPGADRMDWMSDAIGGAVDTLTVRGASVLWVAPGATVAEQFQRAGDPFVQAMDEIVRSHDDVFSTLTGSMPDPSVVTDEDAFLDASVEAILEAAALYQRADRDGQPRVLVIGDSQARSFGFGLERWGNERDIWVWNVAVNGCGLADEGLVYGSGSPQPVREECREVIVDLERRVASFEPDVVVVFSSVWDLTERQLDDWPEPRRIGDPDFAAYLLREYERVVDVASATGAEVVWLRPPCPGERAGLGGLTDDDLDLLHDEVLVPLGEARPAVRFFDLDAVLCPDGESLEEVDGVGVLRADGFHFGVDSSVWFAETYGSAILGLEEES